MKYILLKTVLLFFFLNLSLYANIDLTDEEKNYLKSKPKIQVGFSSVFEPLMIKKNNGDVEGVVPDIYKLFNEKISSKFEIIDGNWKETINNVTNNKLDMIGMMSSITAKEKGLLTVDYPFEFVPTVFAIKDRTFKLYTYDDMKKFKITYPKNVLFIAKYIEENFDKSKLIPANNAKEALMKLLSREADISVNMSFDSFLLKKTNNTHIEPILNLDNINNPICIAIKPEAKELHSIVEKLLNSSDGNLLLEIVEKWSINLDDAQDNLLVITNYRSTLYISIVFTIVLIIIIFALGIIKNRQLSNNKNSKNISLGFHNFILVLTICLILTLGYMINALIQQEKDAAYIINISGKQRMLSQRTMLFAKEYSNTNKINILATYKKLLELMKKDNATLANFAQNNYAYEYYFKNPNLNKLVNEYINLHNKFIQTGEKRVLDELFTHSKSILIKLDHAVVLHEKYTTNKIMDIKFFLFLILILLIAIIIFELMYIFKPTLKVLEKTLEELEVEKKNAEKASIAKSEFLANMSHEIRTPLNGIIGLNDLLIESKINPTQKDYLIKAKQSSMALLNVINDILDYSKIEAGKLDIVKTSFDLHKMLSNVNDLFGYKISEKGLEFSFIIDPDIPNYLIGDSLRITQVLNNYVGNAVKFTSKGFIVINIKLKDKINKNTILIDFEIKDSGIGINEENQKKLFKAFSQADNSTTRIYGGTGLGLTISKQLVELMNGNIWFSSIEGKGSSFGCTLPLQIAKNEKLHTNFQDYRDKKYLIVEDNEIEKEYLEQVLKSWGINASSVSNGVEAYNLLKETSFDYILLDWKMPKLDGVGLLKKLKQENIFVPNTLMVTAFIKKGLLEKIKELDLNINKILQKPYTPSELYEVIFDTEVSLYHTEDEKLKKLKNAKRALLVEDNEVNQLVSTKTLEKLGFKVDLAKDGIEAIDKVKNNLFDIVFMDLQMPNMDGFKATQEIRVFNTSIPIIALSAAVMKKDKELTKKSGMNYHIAKPLIKKDLYRVLEKYFELKIAEYEDSQNNSINLDLPNIENIDIKTLYNELEIDEQSLYKMYHNFKEQILSTINILDEEDINSSKIKDFIHKLKSSSGNLKIKHIAKLAKKMHDSEDFTKEELVKLKKYLLETCEQVETNISPKLNEENTNSQINIKNDFINLTSNLLEANKNFQFIDSLQKIEYLTIAKENNIDKFLVDSLEKAFNTNDQFKSIEILKEILKKETK